MMQTIDELLEDPLFMDVIYGTEEVGLDQTKELLTHFEDHSGGVITVEEIIANRLPDETWEQVKESFEDMTLVLCQGFSFVFTS